MLENIDNAESRNLLAISIAEHLNECAEKTSSKSWKNKFLYLAYRLIKPIQSERRKFKLTSMKNHPTIVEVLLTYMEDIMI